MLQPLECWTGDTHKLFHRGLLPHVVVSKDDVLGVVGSKIDDIKGGIVSMAIGSRLTGVLKVSHRRLEKEVVPQGVLLW